MLHWLIASAGGRAAIDDISVAGIALRAHKEVRHLLDLDLRLGSKQT